MPLVCVVDPEQVAPPLTGGGLSQKRSCCINPGPPQATSQVVFSHSDQPPSTASRQKKGLCKAKQSKVNIEHLAVTSVIAAIIIIKTGYCVPTAAGVCHQQWVRSTIRVGVAAGRSRVVSIRMVFRTSDHWKENRMSSSSLKKYCCELVPLQARKWSGGIICKSYPTRCFFY